jgi:G3E family GTPase
VAVVVDAPRAASLAADETWLMQVEAADIVILSKVDLAPDAPARAVIAAHAPGRPVHVARFGVVPPGVLWPDATPTPRESDSHAHSHEMFTSRSLSFPGVVDGAEVVAALAALAPIRAKGFIRTADGIRVVQGVGDAITLSAPAVEPPASLVGTVVVIDRGDGRVRH